ncbi:MAG: family 43 glycosylhydrolase [Opitutae bacterium]|nr:family 43 glycosylhydrolase [Opitutae bacterium]
MSASRPSPAAPRRFIEPGQLWPDDRGVHIQAHGGAVVRHGDAWFWFGEDRSRDNDPARRCIACYVSRDLVNWTFRGQVLRLADPENIGPEWILERPKVYPCAQTGKFVMYFHLDGRLPGHWSRYSVARVGVAIADAIDGEYRFVRSFRPLGQESRDIGQFIDDDGEAYLIFESRPTKGFFIARLTPDRLDVAEQVAFVAAPIEGGAIVRHDGLYYCIGSHLTGWWPNANKFLTAERLAGPWSEPRDFAPPETATFGSQSTNLLKIVGTKQTAVIYLGDIWRPYDLPDSRYLWHPLEIGGGQLHLEPRGWMPGPWSIDVQTGEVAYA